MSEGSSVANKKPPSRAVLVLAENTVLNQRYPRQVQVGDEVLPVILEVDQEHEIVAAFVDNHNQEIVSALKSRNIPIVYSLQGVMANVNSWSNSERLHILLPGFASDVVAARSAIDNGAIGYPVFLEVSIYVGETLSDPRWEPDSLCALTDSEGIAYGLQLARLLVGPRHWNAKAYDIHLNRGQMAHLGTWSYKMGVVTVIQHVFTGSVTSVPLFSVSVVGETGRLSIREEFSPGVLTIWSNSERAHRCPAISRQKNNIQAPDSWPCGEEFHIAIESAMDSDNGHRFSFFSEINSLVLKDTQRFLEIWMEKP